MKYGFDRKLNKIDEKIIYVKGDYDNGALELVNRLETSGWRSTTNRDPEVMTYISPNGKGKINLRKKSRSWVEIKEAGYTSNATIDVMELGPNGKVDPNGLRREITFISTK